MANSLDELEKQYVTAKPNADRLGTALREQIQDLVSRAGLTLAVPIEVRTKSWVSLSDKLERKSLQLTSIRELPDLVGLRVILLFSRDVDVAVGLISKALELVANEDTAERLGDAQFGYRSHHLVIRLPKSWLAVPTFTGLGDLQAEIQVRTVAQHIWAAASHLLQYKQETNVPVTLRRSVSRVSALLETVDLEFERILTDRATYVESVDVSHTSETLNVDILEKLLSQSLPASNQAGDENYAGLLPDLRAFGIVDAAQLRDLISRRLRDARQSDQEIVKRRRKSENYVGTTKERIDAGVFWTHVGLVRDMLDHEHPGTFDKYLRDKATEKSKAPRD
jgi:putative GTP pyrophosphokinase